MPQEAARTAVGFAIVEAGGEFGTGEAAEDDGVNGADAGAGEHGHGGFGDHRHVDDDAVAGLDAHVTDDGGQGCDFVGQCRVGVGVFLAGDRAVVDQRRACAMAGLHMAVEAVPRGVAFGADEPAAVAAHRGIEDLVPGLEPVDAECRLAPEQFRVLLPGGVGFVIAASGLRGHGGFPSESYPDCRQHWTPTGARRLLAKGCRGTGSDGYSAIGTDPFGMSTHPTSCSIQPNCPSSIGSGQMVDAKCEVEFFVWMTGHERQGEVFCARRVWC